MFVDRTVRPRRLRLLAAVVIAGLISPLIAFPVWAQPDVRDPRDFALTEEEGGGKDVVRAKDEDCSDSRARCLHIRWERDYETDAAVGPLITVNRVWVAKDVDTAKAIYRDQEKLQKSMPDGIEGADGPYTWEPPKESKESVIADEWTAANACVKVGCYSTGRIDLHQRIVARTKDTVSMVYMFGRERTTTSDLLVYFSNRIMNRVNPPPEPPAAWFVPSSI